MDDNYEKQKEELRDLLSKGGFGDELNLFSESGEFNKEADDTVVDEFIKGFGSYKISDFVAHIPSQVLNSSDYCGYLYGIARKETDSFYVIDSVNKKYPIIGYICNENEKIPTDISLDIIITRNGDENVCRTANNVNVRIKQYDEQVKLFSRNSGLLESAWMLNKSAVIIGCGSVGSFIAMELARSGIGRFVLCDTDILEIHNICRHQCGFDDLGRYKVDAVRDKILNINPKADVTIFRSIIQRVPTDKLIPYLGDNSIVIGAGDNRESSAWACDNLAIPTGSSFVSAGCWTRAFAGAVIYWAPGKNLPCYHCALGELLDSEERSDAHTKYFASDDDANSLAFEPGIAVDIDFISIVALKVILDLINKNNPNYTPRVINYLTQYTWICNTNETRIGGESASLFTHPLQITHSLHFSKKSNCPICGNIN